jgi:hypothetical protein
VEFEFFGNEWAAANTTLVAAGAQRVTKDTKGINVAVNRNLLPGGTVAVI